MMSQLWISVTLETYLHSNHISSTDVHWHSLVTSYGRLTEQETTRTLCYDVIAFLWAVISRSPIARWLGRQPSVHFLCSATLCKILQCDFPIISKIGLPDPKAVTRSYYKSYIRSASQFMCYDSLRCNLPASHLRLYDFCLHLALLLTIGLQNPEFNFLNNDTRAIYKVSTAWSWSFWSSELLCWVATNFSFTSFSKKCTSFIFNHLVNTTGCTIT